MSRYYDDDDVGDIHNIVLLLLLKEGPLTLKELEEKTLLFKNQMVFNFRERNNQDRKKHKTDVGKACKHLVNKNFVCVGKDVKYSLTQDGVKSAERFENQMKIGAEVIQKHFLSPQATARNSIFTYVFLSVIKMLAGIFGGSVGLIADGADTTVDTLAAGVVWFGIRIKKEIVGTLISILLFFATAVLLIYESVMSLSENIEGTFVPMSRPYLVIFIELIALVLMFALSVYQRLIGRRNRSLALISQSIDSKNSMYSSGAVIVGALFSIIGVYWVDAVVGGLIGVRITLDGIELMRQVINSMHGKEADFSKFKLPFENHIETMRTESLQNWMLYTVHREKAKTKKQIIQSLEETFKPKYIPAVFSELMVGMPSNLDTNFDGIIEPLLVDEYLVEKNGEYVLTKKGKKHINNVLGAAKNRQI
jgi:cation diffusion facilitator family transporter